MKKIAIILIFVPILLIFINSCSMMCKKGRGKVVTEIRKISDFEEIDIDCQAEVYLVKGIGPNLKLTLDSNLLEYVKTEVSGNKLKIYENKCIKEIAEYKVYINIDKLKKLKVNGSVKMFADSMIRVDNLVIETNNSGDLNLNFDAQNIEVTSKGSGSLILKGHAAELEVELKDAGSVHAFGLYTKTADFDVSGAGTCEISVSEKLTGTVSGSGKLYYKGNPKKVQTDNTGTGVIQTKQ